MAHIPFMNRNPTLHVLCGKLASGKTTLARHIAINLLATAYRQSC